MTPRIIAVEHLEKYRLALTFTDGKRAELDFREKVVGRGGVFAPLEDVNTFARVVVDDEVGTIVFPGEVDFCPDTLYDEAFQLNPV
ncbi:MAG: DUF2442 domain-containing protein [Chloroflexi bacterium]|nr:DUF2442 domain-containing protein [Chloroflexota bacterium]